MRRPRGSLLPYRHDGHQPQIRQGVLHETGAGSSPGTAIATSLQPQPVSNGPLMRDQVPANHQTYIKKYHQNTLTGKVSELRRLLQLQNLNILSMKQSYFPMKLHFILH